MFQFTTELPGTPFFSCFSRQRVSLCSTLLLLSHRFSRPCPSSLWANYPSTPPTPPHPVQLGHGSSRWLRFDSCCGQRITQVQITRRRLILHSIPALALTGVTGYYHKQMSSSGVKISRTFFFYYFTLALPFYKGCLSQTKRNSSVFLLENYFSIEQQSNYLNLKI